MPSIVIAVDTQRHSQPTPGDAAPGCRAMSEKTMPAACAPRGLRVKTRIRTGALDAVILIKGAPQNHGLRVKTAIKAGALTHNHGLRVKTQVRAGAYEGYVAIKGNPQNHAVRVRTEPVAAPVMASAPVPPIRTMRIKTGVQAGAYQKITWCATGC